MSPSLASVADLRAGKRRVVAMAGLALVCGLALTALGSVWVHGKLRGESAERFERLVERVQADVQQRLNAPLTGLRAAAGVYAASNQVDRSEFRRFVEFSQLSNAFPGARGFGFVERVMRADLPRFVAAMRREGETQFALRLPALASGQAADLYIVKYLEPYADNHAALGLDAGADPVRREAIERAITTGAPALSRALSLVQNQGVSPGWVYLLPVFRPGTDPSTPSQRQALLLGLLFAPMVVSDVMEGAVAVTQGQADFELLDGTGETAGEVIYDHDRHLASVQGPLGPAQYADRMFYASVPVQAGGRTLTLHVSSTPAFDAEAASLIPLSMGLGGAALSLLLAACLWLLGSSRARAQEVAQSMTASLAREQQRLQSVLEGTNVGTWEWNVQTGAARFDERWAAIVGTTLAGLVPVNIQTWRALVHPEDLERGDALVQQHFAGRSPYLDCEMRLRHTAGHWVWVLVRGRVSVWTGDAQPALMAGTLMDITERQAAQQALRNSEEHFRQLVETSLESILQTRPDGQVLHANPAACALFGMSVQEMRDRGRGGLVDLSDPRLPALLGERERRGQASGELRMVRRDGSVFECELSSSIFRDMDNQPCANIVLRDITARKRAEARITRLNAELEQRVGERTAQLEASNRDLQEFAHSVAHDLRQPFIAIGGFSGLLERSVEDKRARHYIDRIKAGVRQAGELTDALLALANLSRVELRLQEVDLSALARSVTDKLQQKDPTRVCQVQIAPGLHAQADAMLIRLVLQELLGNAWKFSSRQARAQISFGLAAAGPADDAVAVYVVRDNGEGFDMAHADKLFRSFQRLHSPQEFPGTGVGLANIQRIVARHEGRIWADSAPGAGASFYFTLGGSRPPGRGLLSIQ